MTHTSWPEAFRNKRSRFVRALAVCSADERAAWEHTIADVDRAAEIWQEEQRVVNAAIRQMRFRVVDRLLAECPDSELAEYIRRDDIPAWMFDEEMSG